MSDRELLNMAAKAAGYTLKDYYDVNGRWWPWCHELKNYWHPLTDDGDALRLAVKLEITAQFPWDDIQRPIPEVHCWTDAEEPIIEKFLGDKYAATRRAIVRAAAEIGRGMK